MPAQRELATLMIQNTIVINITQSASTPNSNIFPSFAFQRAPSIDLFSSKTTSLSHAVKSTSMAKADSTSARGNFFKTLTFIRIAVEALDHLSWVRGVGYCFGGGCCCFVDVDHP